MTGNLRTLLLASTGILIPLAANAQCVVQNAGPPLVGSGNVFGSIVSQWIQYFKSKADGNNGSLCNPNISGTVGFNVPVLALPNPTTATTQSQNDTTTKVATDQFVWSAMGVNPPGGRLSPVSHSPASIGNVGNFSQVFYSAYTGKYVPVYNGISSIYLPIPNGEVSDTIPTSGTGVVNATQVFDFFGINNGGTFALCHVTDGSGHGWAGDTGGSNNGRGSGYSALLSPSNSPVTFVSNANSITHCYNGSTDLGPISANAGTYLGTGLTSSSNGVLTWNVSQQASGGPSGASAVGASLWNYYNRRLMTLIATDNGTSYTYSSSTIRSARGSANNSITLVVGDGTLGATTVYVGTNQNTAAVAFAFTNTGYGINQTTAFNFSAFCTTPTSVVLGCRSIFSIIGTPGSGVQVYNRLEQSDGSNANTFDAIGVDQLIIGFQQ